MKGDTEGCFRLGHLLVDPSTNAIGNVRVDPKAMDVLVALAEAAPQVLSSAALLDRVWPNVVVGDNSLFQAIAQLRKALGDQAGTPRFIEHVSRRVCRILVAVEWISKDPYAKSNAPSNGHIEATTDEQREGANGARAPSLPSKRGRVVWSGVALVVLAVIVVTWSLQREHTIKTVAVFPFENLT